MRVKQLGSHHLSDSAPLCPRSHETHTQPEICKCYSKGAVRWHGSTCKCSKCHGAMLEAVFQADTGVCFDVAAFSFVCVTRK